MKCVSECVRVCVYVYEGVRGRDGVDRAVSVMQLLWQIDVKSSGASPPLHRINNDERLANEGLHGCGCAHVSMCVPNASHTCMPMHHNVCVSVKGV